ncbi:MAG TPA: alpha/beta fold hydrolase [Nocardioidaceae bacterium]|nr:alpha/beta fold hydrolase [Nocardioidaceae bacterium]
MAVHPEQQSILSGDLRLAVRDYGRPAEAPGDAPFAPTLIAVHGYPDNQAMWEPVADLLRGDFHVVTYDVRGAGASEAPRSRQDYASERLVDDLVAVMDAVAPGLPVHLLGHDWGSLQLWDAVTTESEDPRLRGRIASYTSISGPSLDHMAHFVRTAPTAVRKQQARKSWYVNFFHVPVLPDLTWRLLHRPIGAQMARREGLPTSAWGSDLARDGDNGLDLYRANILPRLRRPRAGRSNVPVQIVVPRRDPFISPQTVDALDLDRFLSDWHRLDVDGGHWLPRTDPALVAQLVRDWALRH